MSENLNGGDRLETAVLGAGPAGLTAAYVLALRDRPATVFEANDTVGGIAKTVRFGEYRFDLGGHRFYTKLGPVQRLWEAMLGDDFLTRKRLSRIYYKGRYLAYPLRGVDVVSRIGFVESVRCVLSYIRARLRDKGEPTVTLEEWVSARFGRRLYDIFFREYTEKVWGIPGSEIRAEWAAQRIKNLSLAKAILTVLKLRREPVTSLIEEFRYPRLGPGQMWETFQARVEEAGIAVQLNHSCESIRHADGAVRSVVVRTNGTVTEHEVGQVLSSLPLADLVFSLDPPPPPEVLRAAAGLRYRDLCLVALITGEGEPFPDNWIYLQDSGVRAGRVQNFGAWSESMVSPGMTCLGVEYFCFQDDEIWTMPDVEAVDLAKAELGRIGLIDPEQVVDGVKVQVPKAYPMYDSEYERALAVIRPYLESFGNLRTCGRNGLHRYNNQDHSMWTAILATLNMLDGDDHDVWSVNTEAEYLEEGEIVDGLLSVDLTV